MDWLQILSLFFANICLILWFRLECVNEWRYMDAKLDISKRRNHEEMKDFHGRLCAIEERRK